MHGIPSEEIDVLIAALKDIASKSNTAALMTVAQPNAEF